MRIVITGSEGFLGKNLRVRLAELGYIDVVGVTRDTKSDVLRTALSEADFIFHLAGANRPADPAEYDTTNAGFTQDICSALLAAGSSAPVVFTSSTQATLDNPYGRSKLAAEKALFQYSKATGAPAYVSRLTNVFGKWARPYYNSAVATFCYNISRGLPVTINDPSAALRLVHIDDVVEVFVGLLKNNVGSSDFIDVGPVHITTVGAVVKILEEFARSRPALIEFPFKLELMRALYSTYISYLPFEEFSYLLPQYRDKQQELIENIKTLDSVQISYFTILPGMSQSGKYYYSKAERFLVVKGAACFDMQHAITGEKQRFTVHGGEARIVESIPGWSHSINNIGDDDLILMSWSGEGTNLDNKNS